jgi:4-amino-4-deoxy-L-arabinose transferase-like glycosyltransferase
MLRLIRWTRGQTEGRQPRSAPGYLVVTGLLLGLGLVTKATVYVAIPLGAAALALSERRPAILARRALALFGPALVLAIPWYVRNVAVYGWPDLLGTRNHDAVVVGQLRTADYLASVGVAKYLKDFVTTTFHSFWGQFGWMAVPMDRRFYLALGLLSSLIVVGWVLACRGGRLRRRALASSFRAQGHTDFPAFSPSTTVSLVALWLIFTSLVYVYYNISLVQFQGRYLFPMLIPIGWLGALGLREILSRQWTWVGVGICGIAGVIIGLSSALGGDLDRWGLLVAVGAALVLTLRRWLPPRLDGWVLAAPLFGLAGLSIYSLFAFIVPFLSP